MNRRQKTPNARTTNINIAVSPAMKQALKTEAARVHMSLSALVRGMVRRQLPLQSAARTAATTPQTDLDRRHAGARLHPPPYEIRHHLREMTLATGRGGAR